jgi:thioredoxin 1
MVKYLEKNEDFFDLVEKGNYIVDFYADWCGPCKMLGSVLEEIDYIDIIKVNADEFADLVSKFGIMSLPTLLFYKDGLVMQKEIGYRTPEEIKKIYNTIWPSI